jgi:hypothetical protein
VARKKRVHPSLLPEDAEEFTGGPGHGEQYGIDDDEASLIGRADDDDDDDDEEDDDQYEQPARRRSSSEVEDLRRQVAELKAYTENLHRAIPPAQPVAAASEPEDDVNWDELIFKDPKEALRLHGERVAKQVKREMTADYQRDQGERRFWNDFYAENEDLKEDHDLVLATMNKHFPEIGNLPTHVAQKKLADLTRERIMKYSGKQDSPKKRSRAYTEGAEPPKARPARQPVSNVTSLSDIIKDRRAKRFKRGRVA